ncbi:MAG TPA: hypothetical protein VFU32_12060, partial [Ktedonobacterales bacterium]|nr:hypothetical protein [Ktedonobacterales bacterium]
LQGPQANTTRLTQIGMLSHTEGWAIGTYQPNAECTNTLFLRYTGGRWTQVDTISGAALTSVALTSPTNGWAVGTHASTCSLGPTSPVLLYHYDGTTWTPAAVPPETSALGKVVMISATDGWAIGTRQSIGSNGSYSLLLHYDGKTWTEVSVPGINESAVGIAMASATDGWLATSILPDPTAATPTHLHLYQYDGKQWSKVSTPLDTLPPTFPGATLSLAPSGDGWLITSEEQSNIIREPLYLQLTGDTWSHVDGPAGIFGRIFPLSANDAWAVGLAGNESGDGSSLVAAIMHYHNGTWERVPLTSSSTP